MIITCPVICVPEFSFRDEWVFVCIHFFQLLTFLTDICELNCNNCFIYIDPYNNLINVTDNNLFQPFCCHYNIPFTFNDSITTTFLMQSILL